MKNETSLVGQLPPQRIQHTPEGGWKERTCYVVEVTFGHLLPVKRAIMFFGKFNGEDAYLHHPHWGPLHASFAYYLKPVCEIPEMGE